ncbi:hypothetical protein N2152v2_007991 [Parachlorella kessleri]
MVRQPPSAQLTSMPASPGSWSIRSQAGRQHAEAKLYKADEVDASLCMVAQALRLKNHMIADLQARLDAALRQQSGEPAEPLHLTLHINATDSPNPPPRPQLQQPTRQQPPSPQQIAVPLASSPGAESVAAREPASTQGSPKAAAMSDSVGTNEAAGWPVGPEDASRQQEQQDRLAQQLAAAQRALAESQAQATRLGGALAGREAELQQLRQAVEEWKGKAEEQQGTVQQLQAAEAQAQEERVETLTTQPEGRTAELQQAYEQLQPASQASAAEVQSSQGVQTAPAAQALEQQAAALRERLAERESALEAVQQEAAGLRQRLAEKEAELAGVVDETYPSQQQREAQLESAAADLLVQSKLACQATQAQLQSAAGDLLVQSQLEAGSAQAQLASAAADLLVRAKLEAQTEHSQLTSAAADMLVNDQLEFGRLTSGLAARDETIAQLRQQTEELKAQLAEQKEEVARARKEAAKAKRQVEAQLESAAADLLVDDELEAQTAEAQHATAAAGLLVGSQLKSAAEQAQLTSAAADLLVRVKLEAQTEHAKLTSAAADMLVNDQLEFGRLTGALAARDETIAQLQQQGDELREKLAAQQKELSRAWKEAAKAKEQVEAQLESAAADLLVDSQLDAEAAEAQHESAAAGLLVGSQLKCAAEQAQLTSAAADLLVRAKLEAQTEHAKLTSAAADMLVDDQLEFQRLISALAARDEAIVQLQQEAVRLRGSLAEKEEELAKSREEAAEANKQLEAQLESIAADLLVQSQLEAESSAAQLKSVAADLLVQSRLDCQTEQAQLKSAAADLLVQSELDCQTTQAQLKSAAADLLVQSQLEVESLKEDLAARAEAIVQLQQEAAGLRERLAEQEQELAMAREEADKGREQLEAKLKSAAAGLLVQTELEALRAEAQLKSAAADLLVDSQLEVECLKGDLAVRDEVIVQLQQARAKAEERAEGLAEQVQSKIGELQQARAFLAASHEEAAGLKSALRLRDEALAHLQQERAQLEAAMEVRAAEQMQLLDTLQQYLGMCDSATAAWSLEGEAVGHPLPEVVATTGASAASPPPAGASVAAGDGSGLIGADASSTALGTPRAEGPPGGGSSSSRLLELLSPASADRLSHFERRLEFWHQRLASAAKLRGGDSGSLSSSPAKSGQHAGAAGVAASGAASQLEEIDRSPSSQQGIAGENASASGGSQGGSVAVEQVAAGGGPVRLEAVFLAAAEGKRPREIQQEQEQQQQQEEQQQERQVVQQDQQEEQHGHVDEAEEEQWQVPEEQLPTAPSRTESFSEQVFFDADGEQEPPASGEGEDGIGDEAGQLGSSVGVGGSAEGEPAPMPAGDRAAGEGQQGGLDGEQQEFGEQQDGEDWVVLSNPAEDAAEGGSLRRAASPSRELTPPRPIPSGRISPGALGDERQQKEQLLQQQQGTGLESHPIELSPSGSVWLGSSASTRHASLTGTPTPQGGSQLLRSAVRSLAPWSEGGDSPLQQQQQQAEQAQQGVPVRAGSPTKLPFAPRPSLLGRGMSGHISAAEPLSQKPAPAETAPAAALEPTLDGFPGKPAGPEDEPQSGLPSPPPPPPQQQQQQQPLLARLAIPPVSAIPAPRPLSSSLSFSYRPASRVTQLPSSPTKLQRSGSDVQKEARTPTHQQQQQHQQQLQLLQREGVQEGRAALQPSRLPLPPPQPSPPPQQQQQQLEAPVQLSDKLAAALADQPGSAENRGEAASEQAAVVPGFVSEQGRPESRQSSSTASGPSSRQGLARMTSATARRAVPVVATGAIGSSGRTGGGGSAPKGPRPPRVAVDSGVEGDSGIQGAFATELLERLNIHSPRKGAGGGSRSSSLKF